MSWNLNIQQTIPEKPLEILKNAGITQGEAVIGKYARFMERAKKLGKC